MINLQILMSAVVVFFVMNAYAELGTDVCPQLPMSEVYKEVCPLVIGDLEITHSAKSACSSPLFDDAEKVACLSVVGELDIPASIISTCLHPNYTDIKEFINIKT